MKLFPPRVPDDSMLNWFEFLKELNASFFEVSYVAPDKPREGMLRFADGTSWNPGSGRGLYQYVSGAWVKL